MNTYVTLQQHLVADRQQAFRNEARDARLLATASPLPAVSAGSRAAADTTRTWPAEGEPIAIQPRSLGAAAAPPRAATVSRPARSTSAGGCSPCADERTHAAA
jgi:hypothetical protein